MPGGARHAELRRRSWNRRVYHTPGHSTARHTKNNARKNKYMKRYNQSELSYILHVLFYF